MLAFGVELDADRHLGRKAVVLDERRPGALEQRRHVALEHGLVALVVADGEARARRRTTYCFGMTFSKSSSVLKTRTLYGSSENARLSAVIDVRVASGADQIDAETRERLPVVGVELHRLVHHLDDLVVAMLPVRVFADDGVERRVLRVPARAPPAGLLEARPVVATKRAAARRLESRKSPGRIARPSATCLSASSSSWSRSATPPSTKYASGSFGFTVERAARRAARPRRNRAPDRAARARGRASASASFGARSSTSFKHFLGVPGSYFSRKSSARQSKSCRSNTPLASASENASFASRGERRRYAARPTRASSCPRSGGKRSSLYVLDQREQRSAGVLAPPELDQDFAEQEARFVRGLDGLDGAQRSFRLRQAALPNERTPFERGPGRKRLRIAAVDASQELERVRVATRREQGCGEPERRGDAVFPGELRAEAALGFGIAALLEMLPGDLERRGGGNGARADPRARRRVRGRRGGSATRDEPESEQESQTRAIHHASRWTRNGVPRWAPSVRAAEPSRSITSS